MSLRTVIFVDGANFRGNLRDFTFSSSPQRRPYRLEERHFDWRGFYGGVIEKFEALTKLNYRLIRVYWYYAESISPWVSTRDARRLSQRIVHSHPEINGLSPERVVELANEWYTQERDYFQRLREKTFEEIQRGTDFLEFRYVGQYQVHPLRVHRLEQKGQDIIYRGVQVGEKGVDIGIAVDMIAKMPYYDAAILVSGDADFLPVVGYLKDNLKYVYQFSVAKGVPPSVQHLSPHLKGKVDCFASYDEHELLAKYLKRDSGIPTEILDSIDARVTDLKNSAETLR